MVEVTTLKGAVYEGVFTALSPEVRPDNPVTYSIKLCKYLQFIISLQLAHVKTEKVRDRHTATRTNEPQSVLTYENTTQHTHMHMNTYVCLNILRIFHRI